MPASNLIDMAWPIQRPLDPSRFQPVGLVCLRLGLSVIVYVWKAGKHRYPVLC